MAFQFQPTSLILLILFFMSTFLILKASNKFKTKNKSSQSNLPPGPQKFPFIGNLHNLVGSLPHRALRTLSERYGPIMHLQLGELSTVIISSAEAAKQVMKTHDTTFASRPPILVAEIISYNCTSITFGPYGDYWRQLRKICALELLSTKRVQSFQPIREEVFSRVARWISSNEGSPINLSETFYSSTYGVTTRTVLGRRTEEQGTLLPVIKEIVDLASGFDVSELYPSINLFQMVSGLRKRLEKLHKEIDGILEDIIHEHRRADSGEISDVNGKQEDLLDVLLRFQDDGLELPLTTDNIKSVIMDVLGAGSETSSTTMDWAMAEMLKNPQVLEKAQDELRRVFDENGYVNESQFQQLKHLKSIIKETLRLHAPLPLLLPRKCTEKCDINGYEIPVDTKVIVNAWAINRDSKYWIDPECFRPERFLGNNMVDFKGNNFEYIPFGAGRRICPGISFGLANVELPLAMFLYHFDWKLSGGMKNEDMDMSEGFGVTARRKENLWVIPMIRRPLPVTADISHY